MKTAFPPDEILALPLMANLATLASDGSPRNAPVWFHWEDTALWMLGGKDNASTMRISDDPRVAVEIVQYDNAGGVLRHLGFRGRATVEPMNPDLFRRLLTRYLGSETAWNTWFIETVACIDHPDGRLIRLVPDTTFTNDVSFFRTGPRLASSE